MPQVKVTMFNDPIEVPEDEVEVLRTQGLLRDEPEPQTGRPTATKSAPKKDGES